MLLPISTSLNNHFLNLILGTFQIKSKTALSKKNKAIMKGNKSIVKYFTRLSYAIFFYSSTNDLNHVNKVLTYPYISALN
jgi:hypothetical protein